MSDHDQWLFVAALQPVLLVAAVLIAPNGGWVFGVITGGAAVHALHMAYPHFATPAPEEAES